MQLLARRPSAAGIGVLLLGLLALLGAAQAQAQSYADTPFKPDAEPDTPKSVKDGRKWQEGSVSLPAWPRDRDLIELKLDGPEQPLTHFIDKRSLATGSDGVVRFTLVSESQSGARNLTFEGIRCTPKGRWRTYAFGIDGRFKLTDDEEPWQTISATGTDQLHYDLWRHYLCVSRALKPRSTRDQIRMLKSGRVPRVDNAGFMTD
jgi:hypothetical protein